MKENQVAIKIKYYVLGTGNNEFEGELELSDFRKEIHENYISSFEIELADRGGFSNFVVEFILDLSLKDYLMILIGGAAWDLIKSGTNQFFIRPFINLYKKFRKTESSQDIQEITFIFNDSRVLIRSIHQISYEIDFDVLDDIFTTLAKHYNHFEIEGKFPIEIDIPLIEDSIKIGPPIYRYLLSVDEPYDFEVRPRREFSKIDYLKFWGLKYLGWQKYVYKIESSELVVHNWSTEDEYFREESRNGKYGI